MNTAPPRRRAFTLLEMLVALVILLIVIGGVAMIFASTSRAVGTSQALLELTSNVRGVQDQMARDVARIAKGGFLVIRQATNPNTGRRSDQFCFLALGSFSHRTGTKSSDAFADSASATAARIWWGPLVMRRDDAPEDQSAPLELDAFPDGPETDGVLGRHILLLMTGNTSEITFADSTIAAASDIRYDTPAVDVGNNEPPAHLTSSRLGAASVTLSEVLAQIRISVANGERDSGAWPEIYQYCYRHKALPSVYDSRISLANGYFRMTPIALQGLTEFTVEWTDNVPSEGGGIWYGAGHKKTDDEPGAKNNEPPPQHGDLYTALFSYDTLRTRWPAALRVTMRVADRTHRLEHERTFTEILRLPE